MAQASKKQSKSQGAAEGQAGTQEEKVRTIHIVEAQAKKVKFREGTARAEWWTRMQEFNGKPIDDFLKDVVAKPPSKPTKGKLADKLEPPQGWIKFFAREGLVKIA